MMLLPLEPRSMQCMPLLHGSSACPALLAVPSSAEQYALLIGLSLEWHPSSVRLMLLMTVLSSNQWLHGSGHTTG